MTDVETKVAQALSETRTLILGCQILIGIQMTASFEEGFEHLARHAQWLDAVALALGLVVLALLMAPAPFHRVVAGGNDIRRVHGFTTRMAETALLPFACCIAIDIFIVADKVLGRGPGIALAALFGLGALFMWYGLEWIVAQRAEPGEGRRMAEDGGETRREDLPTPLSERITTLLTETRVVLPGAQALLGFQFTAVLSSTFDKLPESSRLLHLASLALVGVAVILLVAPAAYHRIVAGGEDTGDVERFGVVMMLGAMVPLALGLAGDFYVVALRIAQSPGLAITAALLLLALFAGLWGVYPLMARRARQGGAARPAAGKAA